MDPTLKLKQLRFLKSELAKMEGHLDRWKRSASKFTKETNALWKNELVARQQAVKSIKTWIKRTEAS